MLISQYPSPKAPHVGLDDFFDTVPGIRFLQILLDEFLGAQSVDVCKVLGPAEGAETVCGEGW